MKTKIIYAGFCALSFCLGYLANHKPKPQAGGEVFIYTSPWPGVIEHATSTNRISIKVGAPTTIHYMLPVSR